MDRIQFRVHPSVGMARIGKSERWYFLGPEIPRFIQERFPKLRQQPVPLKHPKVSADEATKPDVNSYREKTKLDPADKFGATMPQAARFRVFAYFYTPGIIEPYKVLELKPEHADIEWNVTLANQKGVTKAADDSLSLNPNTPEPVVLSTKDVTPAQECKTGDKPNLAWLKLEKDGGLQTNRLHLIGNEGIAKGDPFKRSATTDGSLGNAFLYQNNWQDTAADGPVAATVELKPAFTTEFSGYQFLIPGTADAQNLPADRKVTALPAWAVVNMPDYTPDMGHFVSLWDLALNQSWKQVINKKTRPVVGRHLLVTAAAEANSYAFYDYFTHIYPQLGLFTDVTYTSGQARAASHDSGNANRYVKGIAIVSKLAADEADDTILLPKRSALELKAAAQGAAFQATISSGSSNPLASTHDHEFVLVKSIDDNGTLHVDRGQNGTAVFAWKENQFVFATTNAAVFTEARLGEDVGSAADTIEIDVQSARRMPMPTPAGGHERDKTFTLAITDGTEVEWLACSKIDYVDKAGTMVARLTVARAQNGTTRRDWDKSSTVIAPATGHKHLNARARTQALYRMASGPMHKMIFGRLRKPFTLYERESFKKFKTAGETVFPRGFGRRENIGVLSTDDEEFNGEQNVDPGGSVSRYHDRFKQMRTKKDDLSAKACHGKPMTPDDPPLPLTLLLPGEEYNSGPDAVTLEEHARQLDDYYWIVAESDMPLLKELAFTHLQYNQFEYWATNQVTKGLKPRWAPLVEVIFKAGNLVDFFEQDNHTREEHIDKLFACRPRYAPAFLDMASMGRMLGGSFLPGIEVGREGGIPGNWSLFHGGTVYFPDVRFVSTPDVEDESNKSIPIPDPLPEPAVHPAGQLTKDLACPWFADFIACGETFWPTSRLSVVHQKNGPAYDWIPFEARKDDDALIAYWTKLGFIRRQPDDAFHETEALFEHP